MPAHDKECHLLWNMVHDIFMERDEYDDLSLIYFGVFWNADFLLKERVLARLYIYIKKNSSHVFLLPQIFWNSVKYYPACSIQRWKNLQNRREDCNKNLELAVCESVSGVWRHGWCYFLLSWSEKRKSSSLYQEVGYGLQCLVLSR